VKNELKSTKTSNFKYYDHRLYRATSSGIREMRVAVGARCCVYLRKTESSPEAVQ